MKKLIYVIKSSIDKFLLKQTKCIVVILGSSVMTLIFPYYMGKLIDQLVLGKDIYSSVLPYLFLMLCSGMLAALFQYTQSVVIYKIQQEFSLGFKRRFIQNVLMAIGTFGIIGKQEMFYKFWEKMWHSWRMFWLPY